MKRNGLIGLAVALLCYLGIQTVRAEGESSTAKITLVGTSGKDYSAVSDFTGDLTIPLPIAAIGRVEIQMDYSSNVFKQMRMDNHLGPTTIVGLGWNLTLGSITADIGGTSDTTDDRYFYDGTDGKFEIVLCGDGVFRPKSYKPWRIKRIVGNGVILGWEITKADGAIFRFGNYDTTAQSFLVSYLPTYATRCYLGINGRVENPAPSSFASMSLIPYQWDLSNVQDETGNHTFITYQQTQSSLSLGGTSTSLLYTRESHPHRLKDHTGAEIEFSLGTKEASEYYDLPQSYAQNVFARKYLDTIKVKQDGQFVEGLIFSYEVDDILGIGSIKRFLRSICRMNPLGMTLPVIDFDYWGLNESPLGPNSGAIKRITTAQGGSVDYSYKSQRLPNINLKATEITDKLEWAHPTTLNKYDNVPINGLAGRDFYVVQQDDSTEYAGQLSVFRFCGTGGYRDDSFPFSLWLRPPYGYFKVHDDFVVLCMGDSMEVVKRAAAGWVKYDVASAIELAGGIVGPRLDVVGEGPDYFIVKHNARNSHFTIFRTWNVAVVKFSPNGLVVTRMSGDFYDVVFGPDADKMFKSTKASCGPNYFVLSSHQSTDLNSPTLTTHVKYRAGGWTVIDSSIPINEPSIAQSYVGRNFVVSSFKVSSAGSYMKVYRSTGDTLALLDSWYSNLDQGVYVQDNFFTYSIGFDAYVKTWNGTTFTTTSLRDHFPAETSAVRHVKIQPLGDKLLFAWNNVHCVLKLGVIAFTPATGQWSTGSIIEERDWYPTSTSTGSPLPLALNQNSFMTVWTPWPEAYSDRPFIVRGYQFQGDSLRAGTIDSMHAINVYPDFVSEWTWQPGSNFFVMARRYRYDPYNPLPPDTVCSYSLSVDSLGNMAANGNPFHFPVEMKKTWSGMGDSCVYSYSYENGVYDESFSTAKYNKVTETLPGQNGKRVAWYYNDLGPQLSEEFVDASNDLELDGMPYRVKWFSEESPNNPTKSSINYYSAVAVAETLGMFYPRLDSTETSTDGVASMRTILHNSINLSDSIVTERAVAIGESGGIADRVTKIRYAFEHYASMDPENAHMLLQPFETTVFESGSEIAKTQSTYRSSGPHLPETTKAWNGTQWLSTNVVTKRDMWGNILESRDISGLWYARRISGDHTSPTITATNARHPEIGYAGMENGWSDWETGGSSLSTEKPHTGLWSAFSQNNYGPTRNFYYYVDGTGIDKNRPYVVEAWVYRTGGVARIVIERRSNTDAWLGEVSASLSNGTGWQLVRAQVSATELSGFQNGYYLRVWCGFPDGMNNSGYVDDVRFHPADALVVTYTYDPVTCQMSSETDPNNVTTFHEYDSFGRKVRTINDDGQIIGETTEYLSRDGNGGTFTSTHPNFVETVSFINGNVVKNWSFEETDTYGVPSGWDNGASQLGSVYDSYVGGKATKIYQTGGAWSAISQRVGVLKSGRTYTASVLFKAPSGVNGQLFFGDAWPEGPDTATYNNSTSVQLAGNDGWQRLALTHTMNHDDLMGVFIYGMGNSWVIYDGVIVEESSDASMPMVATMYTDGLGRTIQTQTREGDSAIVAASEFDIAGRAWKQWRPYKHSTGFSYDPNFVSQTIDYYQNLSTNPYSETQYYNDPLARVRSTIPPGSNSAAENTETRYGAASLGDVLYKIVDVIQSPGTGLPTVLSRKYVDKLGRVVRTVFVDTAWASDSITSTTLYNMLGKPVRVTDPKAYVDTMGYDFLGRKIYGRKVDAGTSRYIYDNAGRLRFMIDSAGLAANPNNILYWKFDVHGRAIEKGYYTGTWNESALRNDAENPSLPATPSTWRKKYSYDGSPSLPHSRGRLDTVLTNNDNDGAAEVEETFIYDKYGRVLTKTQRVTDFNAEVYATHYQYDFPGRVASVMYPSAQTDLTLHHQNLDGQFVYAFSATGTITASDSFIVGPLATATFQAGTQIVLGPGFKATAGSNFNAKILPGEQPLIVTYTYDQLGRVTRVGTPGNSAAFVTYSYNADGRISTETINPSIGGGTTKHFRYHHRRGHFTGAMHPAFSDSLIYDGYNNGMIASTSYRYGSGGPAEYAYAFSYDKFGRLVSGDNSVNNDFDYTWSYDLNGNFDAVTQAGNQRTYSYFSGTNRVQSVNGQTYSYDPNGNVTSSQQKQLSDMTYDPFTMLTMRVGETGQSQHVEFQYGGNKQRVLKMEQVGDSPVPHSVLYLHGLNDYPLTEKYSEQGVINDKKYVYGPSGLIAVVKGAAKHFVLQDHLGSTRVVINDSNQAVSWYDFTPFGDLWRSTMNTDIAYRFTGQEIDEELGLHNFRARMYDSWLGRFYAMDPANEGFGPYSYVFGNPVSFVDPTGRQLGKPEDRQLDELQKYEKFLEFIAESQLRNSLIKQAIWNRVTGQAPSIAPPDDLSGGNKQMVIRSSFTTRINGVRNEKTGEMEYEGTRTFYWDKRIDLPASVQVFGGVGGTFFSFGGIHGEANFGLDFNVDSPLNSRLYFHAQAAVIVGIGGALEGSLQRGLGLSAVPLQAGWSESGSAHFEGGLTVVGGGGASVDITTTGGGFSRQKLSAGESIYVAGGYAHNWYYATPTLREMWQWVANIVGR